MIKKGKVPYLNLVWAKGGTIEREHWQPDEEEIFEDGLATIPVVVMRHLAEIAHRRGIDLREAWQAIVEDGLFQADVKDDPKSFLYLVDENETQEIT